MKRISLHVLTVVVCLFFATGCKTPVADSQATSTEIISDPPGARIEINGEYIGDAPVKYIFHQDKNRKIIGNYAIRALPNLDGESVQEKHLDGPHVPGTGRADIAPLKLLFEMRLGTASAGNSGKEIKSGSGFVISGDGYVLTCYHVVRDSAEIRVKKGAETFSAKLIKKDIQNDLALLKVATNHFDQFLPIAESTSVRLGDQVFTVGFPNPDLQGVEPKFTDGVISSLDGPQDSAAWFQISVPIQPGNSGGPLIEKVSGNVIGITVAAMSIRTLFFTGTIPQNVNYAVKSSYVRLMLHDVSGLSDHLEAQSTNENRTYDEAVKIATEACVMVEAE